MDASIVREINPRESTEELTRVFKAAYRVEASLLGVDRFPPLARSPDDLVHCGNEFFGAREAGSLLGAVELAHPTTNAAPLVIASLAVAPEHFRCGIGSQLVGFVLSKYADRAFNVSTGLNNLPALGLYRAHGFVVIGDFSTPEGIDMIRLGRCCPVHDR